MTAADAAFTDAAVTVLKTVSAVEKANLARQLVTSWNADQFKELGGAEPPLRPGRPARPELRPPREMPRRRKAGGLANRIALLHAIAHIELNAIDLALDIATRFGPTIGSEFIDDWLGVADDEARHFLMLRERLQELGADYGDLPAHDGLWEAAMETRDSLLARLAVAHTVLEARGLDVTPSMIERLRRADDDRSADILAIILADEIGHVRLGMDWFRRVHDGTEEAAEADWQDIVRTRFRGELKPPFNDEARNRAGMPPSLYNPNDRACRPD